MANIHLWNLQLGCNPSFQLKYGEGDDNDYMLKYSRLTDMINILNHQENMEAEYDDFMKAIYVTYKNTGEVKEIKLEKYKIQRDE